MAVLATIVSSMASLWIDPDRPQVRGSFLQRLIWGSWDWGFPRSPQRGLTEPFSRCLPTHYDSPSLLIPGYIYDKTHTKLIPDLAG